MLNKINRLTADKDIKKVFRYGKRLRTEFIMCYANKTNLASTRFAIIISNKTVRKAVDRNLLKRRIREILRTNLANIKTGFDCVLNIHTNIVAKKYPELEKIIIELFKNLDMLNNNSAL